MHQDQGDASQSIRVRIWEIVHIRAFGPRDRENQSSQSRSHRTVQSNSRRAQASSRKARAKDGRPGFVQSPKAGPKDVRAGPARPVSNTGDYSSNYN